MSDSPNDAPTGKWVRYEWPARPAFIPFTVHGQEEVDGVFYVTKTEYDAPGKISRKLLMRADLVKG